MSLMMKEEKEEMNEATDNREPKKIKETTEIEFDKDAFVTEMSDAVKEMMTSMQ